MNIRFLAIIILLFNTTIPYAESPKITVEAGDYDRIDTIVSIPFDYQAYFPDKNHEKHALNVFDGQNASYAQWIPPDEGEDIGRLIFIIDKTLKAGHSKSYTLLVSDKTPAFPPYAIDRIPNDHVTVSFKRYRAEKEGPADILRYNHGIQTYEPDPNSHLSRSGYVHPLYTPAGHIVTGDLCPDHPHQRGCFFAWTKCTFKGEEINFWALDTGKTKTAAPPQFTNGPVACILKAFNELGTVNEPVLNETLTYTLYGRISDGWIIDMEIEQEVVDEPLQVEQYLYGGMAFRGPAFWLDKDLYVITNSGIEGRDSNMTRAKWIQMSGPAEENPEQTIGVTYFDHPANPRYPTHLRVHPSKPYFVFAYHQREGLHIDQKHPVKLKYRILVHDGKAEPNRLDAMGDDLEFPPVVTISEPN